MVMKRDYVVEGNGIKPGTVTLGWPQIADEAVVKKLKKALKKGIGPGNVPAGAKEKSDK